MPATTSSKRRFAILVASYAALVLVAVLSWATVHIYAGALSVVPILFIAYYVNPRFALFNAFVVGLVIAAVEEPAVHYTKSIEISPLLDGLVLSLALCAVVVVTNRLRETHATNEALRGRLMQAHHAAEIDPLTGIVNRRSFIKRLESAIHRAEAGECVALLFCDLDRFKEINDRYGHPTGDAVLQLAAARLVNTVRGIDTVARFGGDEFVVLAERIHDRDEALHMAANVERAFRDPFQSENKSYAIGVTVGVSLFGEDGFDAATLLRTADARMYQRKQHKHVRRAPS